MATSGSVDWTVTRDDIIKASYRLVLADEDFTPTANQTTNASLLLNAIIKSWNVPVPMHATRYALILPTSNTNSFSIGSGHVVESLAFSAISTAALSGASSVTLETVANIANGNQIGIAQDDGTVHWTTVNGAPVGSVVTLTAALTANAAVANLVYVYDAGTQRVKHLLRLLDAQRREYKWNDDLGTAEIVSNISIDVVTGTDYFSGTTVFGQEGPPLKVASTPATSNTTAVYIWPRFSNGNQIVVIRYVRPLEDFDDAAHNPDVPVAWNLPLIYELAISLAPTYLVDPTRLLLFTKERDKWLERMESNEYESGSISFYPMRMMS